MGYLQTLAKPFTRAEFDTILSLVACHPEAHIHFAELFVLFEILYEEYSDWEAYAVRALEVDLRLVCKAIQAYHDNGIAAYVRTLRAGGYTNDEG